MGKRTLYECNHALVFVEGAMTESQLDDVLGTRLYAQLTADKNLSRFTQYQQWSNFHDDVSKKLGWVPFSSHQRASKGSEGPDFTLSDLLSQALKTYRGDDNGIVITLEAYANGLKEFGAKIGVALGCDPLVADCQSDSKTAVDLPVIIVSSANVMEWLSIHFETSQPLGLDMFKQAFSLQALTSPIDIRYSKSQFNEIVFSKNRSIVLEKISAKKLLLIKEVTPDA